MDIVFRKNSQSVLIYLAIESDNDPFEHDVSLSYLNPLPIQAIVTDLEFAQVNYKMPGILTNKAKVLLVEKKYRTLLEQSSKIQIVGDTDYYHGWERNGKMQIREEGDYLKVYIYIKDTD